MFLEPKDVVAAYQKHGLKAKRYNHMVQAGGTCVLGILYLEKTGASCKEPNGAKLQEELGISFQDYNAITAGFDGAYRGCDDVRDANYTYGRAVGLACIEAGIYEITG